MSMARPTKPITGVGVGDGVMEPLPREPVLLVPQHHNSPLRASMHVCDEPTDTLAARGIPATTRGGVSYMLVVPVPIWPLTFSPQQYTEPDVPTAHQWRWHPPETCATGSAMLTVIGVLRESDTVPSPSSPSSL